MGSGTNLREYQLYIDGEFRDAHSGETFESFNPYSCKAWARIPRGGKHDAELAVAAARKAFDTGVWPDTTATQRGALMRKLGDLVARDADRLAKTEVTDNGKLLSEMIAQLRYIPQWFYYFGGLADKIVGAVLPIDKPDMFTFTQREPVGVVVAITPWNSPLLLTAWKMAPALAAGCTLVLKPSEHASASTLEFVKLVEEAGFPRGVVNVVTGDGLEVGEALTANPGVDKIAFTGGETGGRFVARNATLNFTRLTLELGGKSPQIVFPDADVDSAVNGVISGIFAASGQTCIAGSRLLLHEAIHDDFIARFTKLAADARLGDPMELQTNIGPVTTLGQRQRILDYFDIARNEGARCVLGGKIPDDPSLAQGWFVEPTVFIDVTNDMRIAREEIFGPVLSVLRFRDDEEAYRIANDSQYGLAAGVWTSSIGRALTASRRLRAGMVWINTYRAVSFMAPFGGFKNSGIGRENGAEAIEEYLETKTVWLALAHQAANPFVIR